MQGILILVLTEIFLFVPKEFFSKYYHSVSETKEEEKIIRKSGEGEFNINLNEDLSYFEKIRFLLQYKVFIFSMLSMSILIIIITGVQYWVTDYLDANLGIKTQNDKLFLFTVTWFTATVLGFFMGTGIKHLYLNKTWENHS